MTIEEQINRFEQQKEWFKTRELKALLWNTKIAVQNILSSMSFWKIKKSEVQGYYQSKELWTGIEKELTEAIESSKIDEKTKESLNKILEAVQSWNTARFLTWANIFWEWFDLATWSINSIWIATISTTIASSVHKFAFFNKYIREVDKMLAQNHPEIDFSHIKFDKKEEIVEIIETTAEILVPIAFAAGLPFIAGLLLPLIELQLTLRYRLQITTLQVQLYEIAQHLQENTLKDK